ncbi:hypothetical protein RvVAT039_04160 [Agrobacterium vitis]|uniref:hypothetical protein n=1 Tax=Agrobacterium vitis TaxID=373 RepID=UPI0015DA6343|nr:hypothetical protein [Agrobacterium vitis]BCH63200.1 hypothetical protein RvVAT039_04160 [Agrobacterium vitis]
MWDDLKSYFRETFRLAVSADEKLQFWLTSVLPAFTLIAGTTLTLSTDFSNRWAALLVQLPVYFFGGNMLLISPFRLYRRQKAQIERLKQPISISFENDDEYVARNRPVYGDDRIALKLTVSRAMTNVSCTVKSIRRKNDDGWGKPLNDISQFTLGWPQGTNSWQRRDVADQDWIIIFHHKAGKLATFTDVDYVEFQNWKNALPIGDYQIELVLAASNLDTAIRKNLYLKWTGEIDDLTILISDP